MKLSPAQERVLQRLYREDKKFPTKPCMTMNWLAEDLEMEIGDVAFHTLPTLSAGLVEKLPSGLHEAQYRITEAGRNIIKDLER